MTFFVTPRFAVLKRPELELECLERVGSASDPGAAGVRDWVGDKPARDVAYYAKGRLIGFAPGLDVRGKVSLWAERSGEGPFEFRVPPERVRPSDDGRFDILLADFAMLDWDEDLNDDTLQFFCVFTSDAVAPGDLPLVLWPKEGSSVTVFPLGNGLRSPPAYPG